MTAIGTAPEEELEDALIRNTKLLEAAYTDSAQFLREQIGSRHDQAVASIIYATSTENVHFLRGVLHILDELSKLVDPAVIEHSSAEIRAQLRLLREDL